MSAPAEPNEPTARRVRYSVITPTYNRRDVLPRSIDSALTAIDAWGDGEVIVIDDGSTDGTAEFVRTRWAADMATERLRFFALGENLGVTAAKNAGAANASGEWLVFLDSDDAFVLGAADVLERATAAAGDSPFVFVRVRNARGDLVGPRGHDLFERLSLHDLATNVWQECLPVVRATAWACVPYDAGLRGFEGLAYVRMTLSLGPGLVFHEVARTYDDSGADRLSARAGLARRSCELARGHAALAVEIGARAGLFWLIMQTARISFYFAVCQVRRFGLVGS